MTTDQIAAEAAEQIHRKVVKQDNFPLMREEYALIIKAAIEKVTRELNYWGKQNQIMADKLREQLRAAQGSENLPTTKKEVN